MNIAIVSTRERLLSSGEVVRTPAPFDGKFVS
jgi:hypothetical protein